MKVKEAQFIKGVTKWDAMPRDGRPEVAFMGRSNVGKSSLINTLLHRKNLARTSKRPGKTQEFNFYLVNRRFYLVDLPGFGFARVSKKKRERWATFIEEYLNERVALEAIVHLVDSRHPPTDLDIDLIDFMRGHEVPYLIALTKADKLSNNQRSQSMARIKRMLDEVGRAVPIIPTSSVENLGRVELLGWIEQYVT